MSSTDPIILSLAHQAIRSVSGVPEGLATLDGSGRVPVQQARPLSAIAGVVATGVPQNVAHGLGMNPGVRLVIPTGWNAADNVSAVVNSSDPTNVNVTVSPAGVVFTVLSFG